MEWEQCYRNSYFTDNYKKRLDYDLIEQSITQDEIVDAINKTGAKGLAWDCITIWSVKMISILTPQELVEVASLAQVNT